MLLLLLLLLQLLLCLRAKELEEPLFCGRRRKEEMGTLAIRRRAAHRNRSPLLCVSVCVCVCGDGSRELSAEICLHGQF